MIQPPLPPPQNFFLWVLPPLDVRYCRKLSLHAIFRKMKNPNSVKWWETSFFILFQKPASSVNRYHVQLSSCTISEKTNDPILRKQWQTRVISWHGRLTSSIQYKHAGFPYLNQRWNTRPTNLDILVVHMFQAVFRCWHLGGAKKLVRSFP